MNIDSVKPHLNNQIAVKSLDPIQRARLKPNSLRMAVNAQCYDCIYDQSDAGSWRQQVEVCPSKNCPLYCHRPRSTSKGEAA